MNYDSILPPGIHQHVGFFSPPQCLHHKEGVSKHRTKRATPKSPSTCFILEGGTWWSSWKEHVFRVAPIDFFPVFLCIRELDKVIMWYCMVRWRQPCCLLPFANQTCPAFSSIKSQKTCLTMFDRGFFQRLWIEPLFYSQLSRLILAILPVAMFLVSSWWQRCLCLIVRRAIFPQLGCLSKVCVMLPLRSSSFRMAGKRNWPSGLANSGRFSKLLTKRLLPNQWWLRW